MQGGRQEDNAAAWKIDRKGGVVLELIDYIIPLTMRFVNSVLGRLLDKMQNTAI
jgi:hypothetical protein